MIKRLLHIFSESCDTFEGQEVGEKVVLLVHKHLWPLSTRLAIFSLVGLIPILIFAIFPSIIRDNGLTHTFVFVSAIWYLALLLAVFHTLTIYTLNTIIITDRRVIENEQRGFFNRKVSELVFSRIQDISTHTAGVVETFLKFGTLVFQTAASERQFVFSDIPHPEHIKDVVMRMIGLKHQSDVTNPTVHN